MQCSARMRTGLIWTFNVCLYVWYGLIKTRDFAAYQAWLLLREVRDSEAVIHQVNHGPCEAGVECSDYIGRERGQRSLITAL